MGKKHKRHKSKESFEERPDEDGMKVKFKVPPLHRTPSTPMTVSYALEDIVKGRQKEETASTHKSHKHKKHKKKKHHHQSHEPAGQLQMPTTSGVSDPGLDEMDTSVVGGGKSGSYLPAYTREPVDKMKMFEQWQIAGGNSTGEEEEEELSLPVEIDLFKLSLASKSSHEHKKKKKKKHKHRESHQIREEHQSRIQIEITKASDPQEPASPAEEDRAPATESVDVWPMEHTGGKEKRHLPTEKVKELDRTSLTPELEESQVPFPRDSDMFLKPVVSPASSVHSATSPSSSITRHSVKLSKSALKYFLKHLLHQIQKRDADGVFAEPVTDDIAPGYSSIIKQPMDLLTMASKLDNNQYSSVKEFKDDFILMCTNAMTYNTPETLYYQAAKKLFTNGLKIIEKEVSLRPDIRLGLVYSAGPSPSPQPSALSHISLPPPPLGSALVDYSSPFLCQVELAKLHPPELPMVGGSASPTAMEHVDVGMEEEDEYVDQSHLTRLQVGLDAVHSADIFPSTTEEQKEDKSGSEARGKGEDEEDEDDEDDMVLLTEIVGAHNKVIDMAESRDQPLANLSYVSRDEEGKTTLNIINPDSVSSHPLDLGVLGDKVRAGQNAATVLNSELPVFKATPVHYLMYGPFGSFAPTYDTAFATLTKHDSSLLLSTYGSEMGVSYASSLQQFAKGCGGFVTEMADAILNGLTNGRHSKFAQLIEKEENLPAEKSTTAANGEESSGPLPVENGEIIPKQENEGRTSASPTQVGDGDVDTKTDEHSLSVHSSPSELNPLFMEENDGPPVESMEVEESFPPMEAVEDKMVSSSDSSSPNSEEEESQGIPGGQSEIQESLERTGLLLASLEAQQQERLGQHTPNSQLLPPSEHEVETASNIISGLACLASQVDPSEVVSLPSLHHAMGDTPATDYTAGLNASLPPTPSSPQCSSSSPSPPGQEETVPD